MDYTKLSLEELQKLKKEWYQTAEINGFIAKCYLVGEVLGEKISHNYGPKYRWICQGIDLYIDDYSTSYMIIKYNGKQVCSTSIGNKLFIPGEWMDIISEAAIKAEEINKKKKEEQKEKERQKILKELGLI